MKLDVEAKVIRVTYPYIKDPSILPDNQSQVIAMARGQERRLKKLGSWRLITRSSRGLSNEAM